MLYKAPEPDRPHYVSYRTVLKNYELLCYLHNNNIHSVGELENVVDKAEGKYSEVLTAKKKLEDKISEKEKIIEDFPRFTELVNKNPLTNAERKELKNLTYLADKGVLSVDDVAEHKAILEKLRGQVEGCEDNIKAAKAERDKLTKYFDTYTQQVQSDYDFLLERAREEQERKAQAVQIEENYERERKIYYEK